MAVPDRLGVFERPRVDGASSLFVCSLANLILFSRTDVGLWQHNTLLPINVIRNYYDTDERYIVLVADGQEHIVCKTE